MLEKSFGLHFFLKSSTSEKKSKRYVYLRITVDGEPREVSTKMSWPEARWDQNTGRATGTREDARTLNEFLDTLVTKINNGRKKLLDNEEDATAEILHGMVQGKDKRKMILELFAVHNKQMAVLVEKKEFAKGYLDVFETTYDHTSAFLQWQYQVEDLNVRKLDNFFIEQFEYYLKTEKNCGHNTSMKYLASFKKIVLNCVKNKWLQADPFPDHKLTRREVSKEPLTQGELDRVINKRFDNDRLNNVRDIFVFSCYTGLAYADVKKLTRLEIMPGLDGEQWIFTSRQKTETPSRLPILPAAQLILERYKDHPKCANEGKALPVLSNQKMNAYLKEIADLCSINKVLTFHLARHTFATTITLSNGVPIETVSKMLGHTTLKQTLHYAKIVDRKVSEDMAALKDKLAIAQSKADASERKEDNLEKIPAITTIILDKDQPNSFKKTPSVYNYILV
jgi:integrase